MEDDREFLEAQVQAARNGQEAARAQALAFKTTAEFYGAESQKFSDLANRYKQTVIILAIGNALLMVALFLDLYLR